MQTTIRKADQRGGVQLGWLDSRHTFSFGDYYDPAHMGFGPLRVINEDRVAPGGGFPTHPHRDMEIISYVLDGALAHKDSTGAAGVVRSGDVQRMTAGTGVRHSEYNASDAEPAHFLQIWIVPERAGLAPGYEQKRFSPEEMRGRLRLIAAPDARDGALLIHQDAEVYATRLGAGETVRRALAEGRRVWIQVARGGLTVNGAELGAGDGLAATGPGEVVLETASEAEALLFDLPL
ncbi:pirin family protein [Methylocystis echinoides]|uniref:Quercetin 2,3-dioxygenase n=1 Tax=Methylocystis echinoides TaxID=29468 RepID=A0A9W6LQJ5_9HYPH|nr:pirin family protein [Methylocystis echinoides]GLI91431.1 quercetin 2,3-dioxygenase [Methylocystis echinoides]